MSLTDDKISEIEAKASSVMNLAYDADEQVELPINIGKVVERSNVILKFGEFKDKNVSGYYDKSERTIFISRSESQVRKMFTIAHELGHYFLHEDKEHEIFYRLSMVKLDAESKIEEQEANWFAASLLMPKKLISHYWTLSHDFDELAALFGVSAIAVRWRLKNLELI